MKRSGGLLLLPVLVSLAMAVPASAANSQAAAKKRELAKVKARIAAVKQSLDKAVSRRGKLTSELRGIENALAKSQSALDETERAIAAAKRKLVTLKHDQAHQRHELDTEKAALAKQIRAAYVAGRQDRLKLILNQQDPATVQRMLAWYDYFNRARTDRVKEFNARLERLARLKRSIDEELARLANLKQRRQSATAEIKAHRDKRQAVLDKVNAGIHKSNAQLADLDRSRKRLKTLIDRLSHALADIPGDLDSHSFASLRGKLQWPVAGKHLARYGSARAGGRMHWRGVLIGGKAGAPVHAIAHGRVVYAGWLPHFGELLIIDHGGGYMSLYAHNQSLYKEVGDWVRAGETGATLGDSGGQEKPALYFEIRHDKRPVNPHQWCRR
jgi:septal ring factor EnvC (AmiA/AmiB activator)